VSLALHDAAELCRNMQTYSSMLQEMQCINSGACEMNVITSALPINDVHFTAAELSAICECNPVLSV